MRAPKGWKIERLGDIAKCITGNTPPKKDKANYGAYLPLIKPTQLTDGLISDASEYLSEQGANLARVLPPNSVLVSCIGNLGKTGINSTPVAFNQQINATVFNDGVEPKFGFYFMQSLFARTQLEELSSATTIQIVNKTKFKSILVPVPETLDEQRRIVAEIEKQFTRLDAGVDGLKRVQANLKRYRATVLKAACEGRLVPTEAELCQKDLAAKERIERKKGHPFETGAELLQRILIERRIAHEEQQTTATRKKKYKEPAAPDTTDLPELPERWTWANVEQLAAPEPRAITDGPFGSNLKTEHYMDQGPRVIRLQNIGDGVYVDAEAHISKEHFERLQNHRVFANDVVIAGFGENPPRSCLIPDTLGPAIVKADCIRFKPHSSVMPKFMNVALNSDPVRKRTKGMVMLRSSLCCEACV